MRVKQIQAEVQKDVDASGLSGQSVSGVVREQTGHFFLLAAQFTISVGNTTLYTATNSGNMWYEVEDSPGSCLTINIVGSGTIFSSAGLLIQ